MKQVDRQEEALQRRREDGSAVSKGRSFKLRIFRAGRSSAPSPRSVVRRSPGSTFPDCGRSCSTSPIKFDEIAITTEAGRTGRRRRSEQDYRRCSRRNAQARTGEAAGGEGRTGTPESFITLPAAASCWRSAASRCSSARLSDRELALDHDRAAHPRARDAAHARPHSRRQVLRSIIIESLVVGHAHLVVGFSSGFSWPRACSSSSTPSASRCRTAASCSRRGR